MKKLILPTVLGLFLGASAHAGGGLLGSPVTDVRVRGNIMAALFDQLAKVPYNRDSSAAAELGQFLARIQSGAFLLSCEETNIGSDVGVLFRCDLVVGSGRAPSMKISFDAKTDAQGEKAVVDPATVTEEILNQ